MILLALVLLVISAAALAKIFKLPKNIWLLFMAQPLVMCSAPIIVFIGGLLSSQMTDNHTLATLPISLMIIGVATGVIPAAMIAKIKGRKFALFSGFSLLVTSALLAMLAAKVGSFEVFTFASFLFGVGGAFTQQLRFAAIESTKNKEDIPQTLAILMLSGIFAAFLGPEIAVVAKDWLNSAYGYAGSFLLLAGFIVISAIIMLFFTNPKSEISASSGETRTLATIVQQPIFIIAVSCATIGYALMSYLMTATPLSMHHMQGHSITETKWVIQTHIAAMYLPSLITPFLIKRVALKGLLIIGCLIYAVVALIALSGQHVIHYWWALLLLGIGWNFLFLTGTSLLPQSYNSNERHKVQATNDFILFVVQALASLMAGWVLFSGGWQWLVLSSLPFIISLFIIAWYFHHLDQKQRPKELLKNH